MFSAELKKGSVELLVLSLLEHEQIAKFVAWVRRQR